MKERIINIIQELCRENISYVNMSDNLFDNLGFDSIKFINLITEIESEFNIIFEDDELDLEKIDTLEKILALVDSKLDVNA